MKSLTILGATGSIGQSTIDLVAREPERWQIEALTGGRNIARLAHDARRLGAKLAVTADPALYHDLQAALSGTDITVAAGPDALAEAAARPTDLAVSAIVGAAGLIPGLAVIERGGTLALANKETLVCAGPLVMESAKRHNAHILPVDSEHSAIFQALAGEDIATVERVIITASGGAFRDWPLDQLARATVAEASTHPNWAMGQRITIDSASMFNKALEMIEAQQFFAIDPALIEVLIHPQSLIHALVGFHDGALMAHVGPPDMRHAIGYALNWPHRRPLPVERLDLARIGELTFRNPDPARYPALALAREVMERGGCAGAGFNAAKEVALDAFIAGRIGFTAMSVVVAQVMDRLSPEIGPPEAAMTLDDVLAVDHLARVRADEEIKRVRADRTIAAAPCQ